MHPNHRRILVVALAALLASCTVFRPEVRQGNYIDDSKIAQVKPGMTREQVEFLLGPPMVLDGFRRDRWDYVFTLQATVTSHMMVKKHVVVLFDGDRVREVKRLD